MRLDAAWHAQAEAWIRFARDPELDPHNLTFNLPAFLDLVPPAGRRTLDLGCGEGRCGARLQADGHSVVAVDTSPTMVAAAAELVEAIVADAAALPFPDRSFDLVVAFMSLQDMDNFEEAVREVGRVLEAGGRFCFAVPHPINGAGRFEDRGFVIRDSYLTTRRIGSTVERGGIRIDFDQLHRPLEGYSRPLEDAELVIESVREPRHPTSAKWSRVPLVLHVQALKQ